MATLDVRAEKALTTHGVTFTVSLDVFNITNRSTVLGRQFDVTAGESFDQPLEIMNPRLARIGVRFQF